MKENIVIKSLSLYGFISILLIAIMSAVSSYILLNKIEKLNHKHEYYMLTYDSMFAFKYYTQNLLVTTNLQKTKLQWKQSKEKIQKQIDQLNLDDKNRQKNVIELWKVVGDEFQSVNKVLENKLFQADTTMEKSILRRLGEGLDNNKHSDYYLLISKLKNSIDYLQQYEEFLLDELNELKSIQHSLIDERITQFKMFGVLFLIVFLIASIIIIYYILQRITKIELDLHDTKDQLSESLNETRYILDAAMESIMISKNGVCIDVNEETLKTFKYASKDEILGRATLMFIADDSKELAKSKQKLHIVAPYEANCITKDGEILPSLIKAYNFTNEKGEVIRVSAILNLKDIKEKDKLLHHQSKMAAMGEMIANISHQWRQPLSVITTASTGVLFHQEMGTLDDKIIQNDMIMINENAQYLSKTIDDFKNFIKGDAEMMETSIVDALDYALHLTEAPLKNNYINLVKNIDDDIRIHANKNELIQSFINIINNAKDALKDNVSEESRYLFINTKKIDNDRLELVICDSGGGIKEEIIERIFEPYYTTKHQSQGTGLGLAMVNKILNEKYEAPIIAYNSNTKYQDKEYYGACFKMIFKDMQGE